MIKIKIFICKKYFLLRCKIKHFLNYLIINVLSFDIDASSELKDIKGPLDDNIGWSDICPWIVLTLIILLSIFIYKKYFNKKKKTVVVKKKIQAPAHILALYALKNLENKKLS